MAEAGLTSTPVRVLVTGAGGPSAVSVMRSLADVAGADLWAADIDRNAAGLYLVRADRRLLLPRGDDPAFVPALLAWCRSEAIQIVVPTVDQELVPLADARARFLELGVTLVLAEAGVLRTCIDKWRLYETLRGRVRVPRTALLDASFRMAEWELPLVAKPRIGSGSRDIHIVTDARGLDPLPHDGTFLVQEHLPGEEHSVDVLATPDGRFLAAVPRLRLKIDSGVAVAGRTLHDPELETLAREVATILGLSWVANVQTRRDTAGQPRLLEVNARFPGTMPLTVAAGIDMPAICLSMAVGGPAPEGLSFRDVAMVRYLEGRCITPEELAAVPSQPAVEPVLAR